MSYMLKEKSRVSPCFLPDRKSLFCKPDLFEMASMLSFYHTLLLYCYHLFPILVGGGLRDSMHGYLEQNGVGTLCHYPIPPHQQECYSNAEWNTPRLSLPVTERLADEELSIPIGPAITMEEVAQVTDLINKFR